jgi:hypothetical protein
MSQQALERRDPLRAGRLSTPRAAAVAGIAFSVLFTMAYVLMRLSVPEDVGGGSDWLDTRAATIKVAVGLVPFAGIAFLWFIGVIRDRLGEHEDQFFSTVLLGSGLLFLGLTFAVAALTAAMVSTYEANPGGMIDSGLYTFDRSLTYHVANIFGVRMAGVFMVSAATIWSRSRTMPRWLAVTTYALALVQLVTVSHSLWVALIFPGWTFSVSVYILVSNFRTPRVADPPGVDPTPIGTAPGHPA